VIWQINANVVKTVSKTIFIKLLPKENNNKVSITISNPNKLYAFFNLFNSVLQIANSLEFF